MTKRGNHEGSVYREGDHWIAQISFRGPDGRRRKRRRHASTQRDAIRLRAQLLRELDAGIVGETRFAAFARDWLEAKAMTWSPGTYKRQEGIVRRYLIPAFGERRLSDITPRDVRALLGSARHLSARSQNYIRTVLRAMLGSAMREELVTRNVAALVEPVPLPERRVEPLSADQARTMLTSVRGEPLEALYVLAVTTGMRSGELLGLRWGDVDLNDARLEVTHQLQRIDHEWQLVEPKSAAGRRMVALPLPAVAALSAHRQRQGAERRELGPVYEDRDLVFTRAGGVPIHGTVLVKEFQAHLVRAGLPRRRFHDLRHTAVSVMLEQGVPITTIQDVVGHADFALTKNVYGHLAESIKRDAADKMAVAFESARWRDPLRDPLRAVE